MAINDTNFSSKEIEFLFVQNKADRWAAVQCLGLFGVTDSDVIGECVDQMMTNQDMILYEKACSLLAYISNNTVSSALRVCHTSFKVTCQNCIG